MKICKFWSGDCKDCPYVLCYYEAIDDDKFIEGGVGATHEGRSSE